MAVNQLLTDIQVAYETEFVYVTDANMKIIAETCKLGAPTCVCETKHHKYHGSTGMHITIPYA